MGNRLAMSAVANVTKNNGVPGVCGPKWVQLCDLTNMATEDRSVKPN